MNELEELLSITACDCGRPYCDFFSGLIGEYGQSFSRKEIKQKLKELEKGEEMVQKARAHLQSLLGKV